jgi:hypothetical protein
VAIEPEMLKLSIAAPAATSANASVLFRFSTGTIDCNRVSILRKNDVIAFVTSDEAIGEFSETKIVHTFILNVRKSVNHKCCNVKFQGQTLKELTQLKEKEKNAKTAKVTNSGICTIIANARHKTK